MTLVTLAWLRRRRPMLSAAMRIPARRFERSTVVENHYLARFAGEWSLRVNGIPSSSRGSTIGVVCQRVHNMPTADSISGIAIAISCSVAVICSGVQLR